MERLTAKERDERYGSVLNLMVEAMKAYKALDAAQDVKGRNKDRAPVSEAEVRQLEAAVQKADQAVTQATAGYTPDEVKLCLAYLEQAVIAMSTTPGDKGATFDAKKARWLADAIRSARYLPNVMVEHADYRAQRTATFAELFGTIGRVPRGMTTDSVRYGLNELNRVGEETVKQLEAARNSGQVLETNRINLEVVRLRKLYDRVTSLFRNWLAERQPAKSTASIGEQVGPDKAKAVSNAASEEEAPDEPSARRPRARSRR